MQLQSAFLLLGAAVGFASKFTPSHEPNMNGDWVLSNTPGATPGLFPKQYSDFPYGVEYFDVLSPPMTTYYSQVWWSPLAPVSFPKEMVEKYAGKKAAIVGWEIDQVRSDGVSVPINACYNHHYNLQVIGDSARFEKVFFTGPEDPRAQETLMHSHGNLPFDQAHYIAVPKDSKKTKVDQQAHYFITSANGGEYRKSFHGFAPGYAIVVDSPSQVQLSPMQIDTWNRDEMNFTNGKTSKFVPGPLPRASEAPENAMYSGLLECPMTTRLTKVINGGYKIVSGGESCAEKIQSFQECYHAAAVSIGSSSLVFFNSTGSDPSMPIGCSVRIDDAEPLRAIHTFFNTFQDKSGISCAESVERIRGAIDVTSAGVPIRLQVELDSVEDEAIISIDGPADVWFGIGFGAQTMGDRPWTLIVDGNGTVSERHLGGPSGNTHVQGDILPCSIHLVNSSVTNGRRSVFLTRKLEGAGAEYFTFNTSAVNPVIPFIAAVGNGPNLAYHRAKVPSQIALLPTKRSPGACVCPEDPKPFGQASGSLVYHAVANQSVDTGTGAVGFAANKCAQYPATNLIQQKNPTCDIRYYRGGQWACHHKWSLLDADQDIPWTDQPLVFHHKHRFWVQPYNESYHTPLHYSFPSTMLIGSPWEYDVPKCADGVAGCSFVNGTWIHTIQGSKVITANETLATLNFHCHAPTCLSMSVYACPKNTPLELCNATNGKLLCEQRPVYGGSGSKEIGGSKFDEDGYIAIPDCVWGGKEFGLEDPINLENIPIHMVKTANATWAHYGEMAGGQPFAF